MIIAESGEVAYQTRISNRRAALTANTVKDGRGGDEGFRPHELLEAALASCLAISVRMAAEALGTGPLAVRTAVRLDRAIEGRAVFRYRVSLEGALTGEARASLLEAARACAVGRTLRRVISLEEEAPDASELRGPQLTRRTSG